MANSAFDHAAALSIPSSTTQYGLVTWDSNNGGGLLSSSVVLSTGGALSTLTSLVVDNLTIDGTAITTTASNNAINLTPHGTGAVVISKTSTPTLLLTNSGNSNAITLNTGTTAANYTITMPTAAPAAGKFLKTTYGSTTQLEWGDAGSSGATLSGSTDNTVVTVTGANAMQGEATLTFGSNALSFDNDHAGNNAINLINDENNASASTRLTIQTGHANGGDAVALFHAGGQSYIVGVDNSETDNPFKIAATGGNLGTNDRVTLTPDGAFDLYKSGGGSTTNGHVTISHSGVGHGLTTLPATDHINSAQAVTASTYFAIQPGWYATGGGTAVKSFSEGNTGFYLTSWVAGAWTTQATNQGGSCQVMTRFHDGSNGNATINSAANLFTVGYYDGTTMARRFHFTAAGDGYADSSWTTFSDNRLKFNQEVLPYGLDTLMQLQPKVYDKYSGAIKDGVVTLEDSSARREIGFIAQEIKALVPEIVTPNADENNGWYALDDGKLMAVVVKAIQELKAEIDELKG